MTLTRHPASGLVRFEEDIGVGADTTGVPTELAWVADAQSALSLLCEVARTRVQPVVESLAQLLATGSASVNRVRRDLTGAALIPHLLRQDRSSAGKDQQTAAQPSGRVCAGQGAPWQNGAQLPGRGAGDKGSQVQILSARPKEPAGQIASPYSRRRQPRLRRSPMGRGTSRRRVGRQR
jgi:hypothetical protein